MTLTKTLNATEEYEASQKETQSLTKKLGELRQDYDTLYNQMQKMREDISLILRRVRLSTAEELRIEEMMNAPFAYSSY